MGMNHTAADYLRALLALLPPGLAFPREPGSIWTGLLSAWSEEFARVEARAFQLLAELDPRSARESLPDWERMLGLPSACMAGVAQNEEQRRGAVLAQLRSQGGQSRAYFIALAAAAGYEITISEFRPCRSNMRSDARTSGLGWAHTWMVTAPSETVTYFRSNARSGDREAQWGNELLECVIRRAAPAHTVVLFAYRD
jgi:uncharacterized protein YmfQ (DUF2313 family)